MSDDVERAERSGKRRARVVTASAILFLTSQAASFGGGPLSSRPEHVRLAAWMVWAVVLLVILMGGGGWAQGPAVRRLMNDDVTREHRRQSLTVGFWFAMGTAALVYALGFYEPVTGQEAGRLVITLGIASALLWFARQERRAYRHG